MVFPRGWECDASGWSAMSPAESAARPAAPANITAARIAQGQRAALGRIDAVGLWSALRFREPEGDERCPQRAQNVWWTSRPSSPAWARPSPNIPSGRAALGAFLGDPRDKGVASP